MAALDFPSSPTLNQTYTANGLTYLWNGTSWITNNTPSPGNIIQVVQNSYSTEVTGTNGTWNDTNLSCVITPKFSTSKILIYVVQQVAFGDATSTIAGGGVQLLRGSTVVFTPGEIAGGPFDIYVGVGGATFVNLDSRIPLNYLDSPATSSAVTYKTQIKKYGTTDYWVAQESGSTSIMQLLEVAA